MNVKQLALKTLTPWLKPIKGRFKPIKGRFKQHWQWSRKGKIIQLRPLKRIIHPIPKLDLQACLAVKGQLLGMAGPQWQVYCYQSHELDAMLMELGRLREINFRLVGEGTGKSHDLDQYDLQYQHLLLWQPEKSELVAAYRIRATSCELLADKKLYSQELFEYLPTAAALVNSGAELGRSFICAQYWHSRSLDYLWQGIGLWLQARPEVRYLFGPVSLPGYWPKGSKDLLLSFYRHHFSWPEPVVRARCPVQFKRHHAWTGNYQQDFSLLKQQLAAKQLAIPTLYKQYTELCLPGGVGFADFNLDASFGNCIDGLVVVDLKAMKANKARRYLGAASLHLVDPAVAGP